MLADEIVEELLCGNPGFAALLKGNDAIDDESLRHMVEKALHTALGPRQPDDREPCGGHPSAGDESEVMHDGRREAGETQEAARDGGPAAGYGGEHGAGAAARDRHKRAVSPDRTRQDLFEALTDDRAASDRSLTELAEATSWPLPPTVRAVILATPGETQRLAALLEDTLAGRFAGRPCLLVPSPNPDARAPWNSPCGAATQPSAMPSR
ncbi:hypothetical protein ACFCYM_29390 [Streptomyces sp. NPDC056254]|uniref:hypothetical protein n=1 Tax=Streptomyces sp. NPDC056254 TaxID=3345763 RepID=UPI0035DC0566